MLAKDLCNVHLWIGIIIAMDFRAIQWLKKSIATYTLPDLQEDSLITKDDQENHKHFPTLQVVPEKFPLLNMNKYHMFILQKATTMKNAGPGFVLLRLKLLAFLKGVRYTNCSLFMKNSDLPTFLHSKELALALMDFGLLGNDALCEKVAELIPTEDVKEVLTNFATAMKMFDNAYRKRLCETESTTQSSYILSKLSLYDDYINNALAQETYTKLVEEENNMLLSAFDNMNKLTILKMFDAPAQDMDSVAYRFLGSAIHTCLQTDKIFQISQSPEGELDFMKALTNAEMQLLAQYICFKHQHIYDQVNLTLKGDFQVDENAPNGKIIIEPEKSGKQ